VNDQILWFGDIVLKVPIKNIFFLVYMKEKPTYISSLLEAALDRTMYYSKIGWTRDYFLKETSDGTKRWNGSNYVKR
jgi:hypothetical protein